ncbi:MAG: hypothetical protein ACK4RK_21890, partial [Gemmataceae bacterium]
AAFHPNGHRLVTASADGIALLWELPPLDTATEEISRWARLLSAKRIDTMGYLVPLSSYQLRAEWEHRKHHISKKTEQ